MSFCANASQAPPDLLNLADILYILTKYLTSQEPLEDIPSTVTDAFEVELVGEGAEQLWFWEFEPDWQRQRHFVKIVQSSSFSIRISYTFIWNLKNLLATEGLLRWSVASINSSVCTRDDMTSEVHGTI